MRMFLGQLEQDRRPEELEALLMRVCDEDLFPKVITKAEISSFEPLKWCVTLNLELTIKETSSDILAFLVRLVTPMGHGTYHFRCEKENILQEFWDKSFSSIFLDHELFDGMPLNVTINAARPIVDVDLGWTGNFLTKHFSKSFQPVELSTKYDQSNAHYLILNAIRMISEAKGNWYFRLAKENKRLLQHNSDCADLLNYIN